MNDPKRYFLKISQTISGLRCDTFEDKDGMYVDYEDYARLKAENEKYRRCFQGEKDWVLMEPSENARLKAEVERLTERNQHLEQIDSYLQSANLNAEEQRSLELEAQVERLTKAGDWMMADLIPYQQFDGFKSVKDWNAAKGVQS